MSRPPYPHRCLGGDPFVWACRCKATPDPNSDKAARDGWGSGCRVAMELRIADLEIRLGAAHDQLADIAALARGEMEPDVRSGGAPVLGEAWEAVKALRVRAERAEAALASGRACSNPLTALLDRLAEGAQVAAEEVDAAVGSVATFDSEAPALAGLGGEQMQRVRLEVACVRGDSLTPQARLREHGMRAGRAEAERDDACGLLESLPTWGVYGWRAAADSVRAKLAENAKQIVDLMRERDAALAEALRLRDIVRHQRGPLHDAELITDEEYATLASDAGSVARLRRYDELRRESRADVDKAVAAALEARAKELDNAADTQDAYAESREDRVRAESLRRAASIVRGGR